MPTGPSTADSTYSYGGTPGSVLPSRGGSVAPGRSRAVLPLEGKTAVVTGSSRGIGKVLALRLAQEGANIVVCARSQAPGELPGTIGETAAEVEALGRRALPLKLDLTEDADI